MRFVDEGKEAIDLSAETFRCATIVKILQNLRVTAGTECIKWTSCISF